MLILHPAYYTYPYHLLEAFVLPLISSHFIPFYVKFYEVIHISYLFLKIIIPYIYFPVVSLCHIFINNFLFIFHLLLRTLSHHRTPDSVNCIYLCPLSRLSLLHFCTHYPVTHLLHFIPEFLPSLLYPHYPVRSIFFFLPLI